ncbi:hypothetical protein [Thermicanus aegyptius]|uniref:hypothetical protein n=1 Tax=Thermicanus aegyptius TaxID=94009 RepID=UPI000347FD2B|nr:hypothetical protein [Thermicanus aegyptius]
MDREIIEIDSILKENLERHLIRTGFLPFAYHGDTNRFYRALEKFHRQERIEHLLQPRGKITLEALERLRNLPDSRPR